MKADLHCHSHYSDGKHSPHYLVERARAVGLTHLAITDHDCIGGLSALAHVPDLTIINGVEISCAWQNKEIHVVGLVVNTDCPDLNAFLLQQQLSRRNRLSAINQLLLKLDIGGLEDYIDTLPCQAVTRTHVANFLIQEGICKNHQKAFKQYLGKRGRAYVAASWRPLPEAVEIIRQSAGIAVLAHPGRYTLSKRQLGLLIDDFHAAGGEAIEGSYGNIDPVTQKHLQELALRRGLYLSQGSDFHSQSASWTDLGRFPSLNSSGIKNAIWHHPRWHS